MWGLCPAPQPPAWNRPKLHSAPTEQFGSRHGDAATAGTWVSFGRVLEEVIECLTRATVGCAALMDVTEQNLAGLGATNATAACQLDGFVGPTTSAPLAVFQTITIPTTTTTTQPRAAVILGGQSSRSRSAVYLFTRGPIYKLSFDNC